MSEKENERKIKPKKEFQQKEAIRKARPKLKTREIIGNETKIEPKI